MGSQPQTVLMKQMLIDQRAQLMEQQKQQFLREQRQQQQYQDLTDLCSHYHAVLDYPDEDIPEFRLADFARQLEEDCAVLRQLEQSCERGNLLKNGVKVALLG